MFSIKLPVGQDFPWKKIPADSSSASPGHVMPRQHEGMPLPVSGVPTGTAAVIPAATPSPVDDALSLSDEQDDAGSYVPPPSRRVRGKSTPSGLYPSVPSIKVAAGDSGSVPDFEADFFRYGVPDLDDAPARPNFDPVDFVQGSSLPEDSDPSVEPPYVDRVTLRWAEPLHNRNSDGLRLAVMQAIAKCKAYGIPVLRFHSDRAKEFQSSRLIRWLTEQAIHVTKSAPEDPAANGTAESAVKEVKRYARRCLISSGLPSSLWPLAVRQASEQSWRSALARLGCPTKPLLPFGTVAQARSREWLKRSDKQWSSRTLSGHLVGPAPQTLSADVVLLEDSVLYISSSVHPVASLPDSVAVSAVVEPCAVQINLLKASSTPDLFTLPFACAPELSSSAPAALRAIRSEAPVGVPVSLPDIVCKMFQLAAH